MFKYLSVSNGSIRKNRLLIVVAATCLVLLFAGGPQSYSQRSHEYAWGLGHILCFGVWTNLLMRWLGNRSFGRQFVAAILLTLTLGIGIEMVQAKIGRYFDLVDVLNNLIGTLLALAFSRAARLHLPCSTLILLRSVALVFLFLALVPLGQALLDERRVIKQFPLLSDFETSSDLQRWKGSADLSLSQIFSSHGHFSLKAELSTDQYSGMFLRFFPEDWRGYRLLAFDLYNPSDSTLEVTCRVHDRLHARRGKVYADRFNRTVLLAPGLTRVELSLAQIADGPRERQLELGQVAGVGIFVTDLRQPEVLYLDNLRLLP